MSYKILIISPHFPPINAPDHQRVRMSLPYFELFGWEPHVLTVQPDYVEGLQDPLLIQTIPKHIPVTYTKALPIKQTRRIGMGSFGLRSFPYLLATGDRLLREKHFDLVYFSTTIFTSMGLSLFWHRRFGIPYILDFQDPWLSDYYEKTGVTPPGGHFKYGVAQLEAKFLEPKVLSKVNHVISVSPAYPETLQQRYPHLNSNQFSILPFGAPEHDFDLLPSLNIQQTIFNPNDGKRHWVYVGRGGDDMAKALRILFLGIKTQRSLNPEIWRSVHLHFVGTSYALGDRAIKTIEPIAKELEIEDLVTEHPHRIPYFEALQVLSDSDAILMIGSDDPSYTASKLYPCVLACKPILAVFHNQSSVVNILHSCQAGQAVTFASSDSSNKLLPEMVTQLNWLLSTPKDFQPKTNWSAFEPYTAKVMTQKQCVIFNQCLEGKV